MEIFIKCLFSDNHLIGDNGTVKRLDKGKIKRYGTDVLIGMVKPDGYKMYYIKGKRHYAHRLVGQHFIPNPDNLPEINHYDGNKLNNGKGNLQWCTHSDNHKHRFDVLGQVSKGAPKGYKHTSEAKQAMRDAKLGRKRLFRGKWL